MGELGGELSRHRLRLGLLAALVAAAAVGVLCLALLSTWLFVVAVLPVGLVGWLVVTRGRDQLVVYRDGFTFRHAGRVRACRWGDIQSFDAQMGSDRRMRVYAVTTRRGEQIAFSRFMGGLDALHRAYETRGGRDPAPGYAPAGEGIGALLTAYPMRNRRSELLILLIPGFLLLIAVFLLFGALSMDRDPQDIATALGCVTVASAFVALMLWVARGDRDDELRIHQDGFAYRHRRVVQECRWDEIADFQYHRRGGLHSVMKLDGTWISLSSRMPEVQELVAPRVRRLPRI
ncbi:hypothetical protein [Asanoa iriomotensis]|uniref:PH domain-containing protein n=1 Tax=Asanoa iriomotensis TaxID=234613 RepID=A0ABQ4C006_9ACTN|nr:hypothetical protein [Asanoa iriomotensis]GIF55751.1 hypothetical protein Air01nite_18460 [Asanoa iriomotensis]